MSKFLRRLSTHLKVGSHSEDAPKPTDAAPTLAVNTNSNSLTGTAMSASPVQATNASAKPAAASKAKPAYDSKVGNGMTREKIEAERQARAAKPDASLRDQVAAQAQVGEAQRQAAAGKREPAGTTPATAGGQTTFTTPNDPNRGASVESAFANGYVKAELVDDKVRKAAPRLKKRLVVFCDGTWQDGSQTAVDTITNVLRLARCVLPEDFSTYPPTPQIVYYQSGVGTTDVKLTNITQGATGAGVVAKIREAYTFIAQNFLPGDEIMVFGFSRGAYTARMIAALIGDLGVLPRTEMENFYTIFKAYQARGSSDEDTLTKANAILDPLKANLKLLQDGDEGKWGIRCVGVFDTVGALGIPGLNSKNEANFRLLGFIDTLLGPHIAHAFHALALDEPREDFSPTKWIQTKDGKSKGQVLEQVWFNGCHTDVGGGYKAHDLADLTLSWMMANLIKHDLLALDVPYFYTIPQPHATWGTMKPHDPRESGFMALSFKEKRKPPKEVNEETQETYHASAIIHDHVKERIKGHPILLAELMPLEIELRDWWSQQAISKSYDEVGHGGIFSNLLMMAKDVWDGDEEDETAGGGITKAESRKDALDAVRGAPDIENAPPPMKISDPNAPASSTGRTNSGFVSKTINKIHDLVD